VLACHVVGVGGRRFTGAMAGDFRPRKPHCMTLSALSKPCGIVERRARLQDAAKWDELLSSDIAKARKALEQWRTMAVSDEKLARALREGASTAALGRAIQEASASGVKVQHAKRVLKLMQALEGALATAASGAETASDRCAQAAVVALLGACIGVWLSLLACISSSAAPTLAASRCALSAAGTSPFAAAPPPAAPHRPLGGGRRLAPARRLPRWAAYAWPAAS
jgi:hypothetical protein